VPAAVTATAEIVVAVNTAVTAPLDPPPPDNATVGALV
jgi:hypothetical protein